MVLIVLYKYISEPVLSYFYLSEGVESVLLLLPQDIFAQVQTVNTFDTSDRLWPNILKEDLEKRDSK